MTEDPKEFGVILFADEWRIVAGDGAWGRFQLRQDAEIAAHRLAALAEAEGGHVEVLVQQPYGELLRQAHA